MTEVLLIVAIISCVVLAFQLFLFKRRSLASNARSLQRVFDAEAKANKKDTLLSDLRISASSEIRKLREALDQGRVELEKSKLRISQYQIELAELEEELSQLHKKENDLMSPRIEIQRACENFFLPIIRRAKDFQQKHPDYKPNQNYTEFEIPEVSKLMPNTSIAELQSVALTHGFEIGSVIRESKIPNVEKGGFTPSPQQAVIFDLVENTNESLIVQAVAGSGKSTTIVNCVELLSPRLRILILAFNTDIVKEMKAKLAKKGIYYVDVSTINAHGNSILKRNGVNRVDKRKQWKCVNSLALQYPYFNEFLNDEKNGEDVARAKKIISRCKAENYWPEDEGFDEKIEKINRVMFESEGAAPLTVISKALIIEALKISMEFYESERSIDFDDQVYIPVRKGLGIDEYDVVFVDESQDLNTSQIELVKQITKPGGRVIAVGDKFQAIYGFRGANSNSMQMVQEAFDCKPCPLSVSYRCPSVIVDQVYRHTGYTDIVANEVGGHYKELKSSYYLDVFQKGDFVICRNNAPLLALAFRLLAAQIPFSLAKDFGKSLIDTLDGVPKKHKTVGQVIEFIDYFRSWAVQKGIVDKKDKNAMKAHDERCDILEVLCKQLEPEATVQELKKHVQKLLSKKEEYECVNLKTIHGSKGLEAKRVFLLDLDLIPSKYAKSEEELAQEQNLKYVALTRACEELYLIDSPNKR